MKCMNCGSGMSRHEEMVPYRAGLSEPVVLHDVAVYRCGECDEYEVEIPHVERLHQVIARHVARRKERLGATEIRFLRQTLGWSGQEFAGHMRVAPETVSRWETGAKRIGDQSELLLRMYVLLEGVPDQRVEGEEGIHLRPGADGWSDAA